MSSMRYRAGTP